jgi:hypothetical protein
MYLVNEHSYLILIIPDAKLLASIDVVNVSHAVWLAIAIYKITKL